MCRFIAYIGEPLVLDEILFKPTNSLVKQSIHARELTEPLNGDGFGLGWYVPEIDLNPALFRSIQPAWNDQNLKYLSKKIRSNCFFAHVRSASQGNVSQDNCHPFHYKQCLFMHNGDIGGFKKIKRYLRRKLTDEFYDAIKGQTDTEHLFYLFLNNFYNKKIEFTTDNIAKVIIETIKEIEDIKRTYNSSEHSYINAVLTNGNDMVVVRYVSDPDAKPLSLYYTVGKHFECIEGICQIHPSENNKNQMVLVASEQLSDYHTEWLEVPVNYLLLIENDLSTSILPI